MNKLINIKNEDGKQAVLAKELYLGLGLNKAHWSRWYPTNIQDNDFFLEKESWVGFTIMENGNDTMDFAISIDFAKHIAMMARTEKSHEYRNYFIEVEDKLNELSKPQTIEDLIILQAQSMKDMKQQLNEVNHNALAANAKAVEAKEEVQAIRDVVEIRASANWRNETNNLIKKICFKVNDYSKPKEEVYRALQERGSCDLKRRLENMRARLLLNGGSKSKADNLNFLDVITEDKKLIEIYVAIVKELAIKYKIA
jgi:anti-repressor protein